jgi:alkylation response protein AidB-like acyl-CoA dehydrogenase
MLPVGAKVGGASEAAGTLPQALRRDFSGVDYGEAIRRAREIVPMLRERAQRAEDARMLIRENEQLLHESGLFRFHQPKAFGGMELPFVAVVDIPAELARAARRPHGTWETWHVTTGSSATTSPRPSAKSGRRTRTR